MKNKDGVYEFATWKDFYHFMQWFEGELRIRKSEMYFNGELVAKKI